MFGLMRSRACSLTADQKYHRRLHYCGTCKTLGRLYGQKTRLMLNYDTVFLAEVLTALSGEDERISQWGAAYQSYNCLSLPARSGQMPIALEYAATATVVLSQFKVADNVADTSKLRWKTVERLFSKSFRSASMRLKEWQFPFDDLGNRLQKQNDIEAELSKRDTQATPDEAITRASEPTAIATAMVMRHGARLVRKEESEEAMYRLGYSFGSLVYLLDALEDYEKDSRRGEFNALVAAFALSENRLPKKHRDQVHERLWSLVEKIESAINELPIKKSRAGAFISRLRSNLSTKLGVRLPVLNSACEPRPKTTIAGRGRAAITTARALTVKHIAAHRSKITARLQAPLVFASVLPVAFVLPQHTASATSYRECIGMAFNLMLLGSVFTAALPATVHHSSEIDPGTDVAEAGEEASAGKRGRRGQKAAADDSDSHWYDWCDCCECCTCCTCIECSDCC